MALWVHFLWHVAAGGTLAEGAAERLAPYLMRYGQTLGCKVSAVGGGGEHLHLFLELPLTKSVDAISGELSKASARFVREAFGPKNFAWDTAYDVCSVSPEEAEMVAAYVRDNAARHESGDLLPDYEGNPSEMAGGDDDTPDWLREALDFRRGNGGESDG